MSPEERKLLEESVELSRENNRLLRKLRGAARWQQFFSALKWLVILASVVGSYYYLQPWIDKLVETYGSLTNNSFLNSLNGSR
jgi:hypothetical protein